MYWKESTIPVISPVKKNSKSSLSWNVPKNFFHECIFFSIVMFWVKFDQWVNNWWIISLRFTRRLMLEWIKLHAKFNTPNSFYEWTHFLTYNFSNVKAYELVQYIGLQQICNNIILKYFNSLAPIILRASAKTIAEVSSGRHNYVYWMWTCRCTLTLVILIWIFFN